MWTSINSMLRHRSGAKRIKVVVSRYEQSGIHSQIWKRKMSEYFCDVLSKFNSNNE